MTAPGDHVYQIFKRRSITRPHRGPILDALCEVDRPAACRLTDSVSSPCAVQPTPNDAPESLPPAPIHSGLAPESIFTHEVVALERALIEILARDPRPRETIDAAFRRKEQQVGEVFAALTPAAAHALHERLEAGRTDDALAKHFGRLTVDRRQRLLGFLADTPRRVELARKGRP